MALPFLRLRLFILPLCGGLLWTNLESCLLFFVFLFFCFFVFFPLSYFIICQTCWFTFPVLFFVFRLSSQNSKFLKLKKKKKKKKLVLFLFSSITIPHWSFKITQDL